MTKRLKSSPPKGKPKEPCVVLMPISNKFKNQWELAVKPAIEKAGLEPSRADEAPVTDDMIRSVAQSIFGARILIADVTGSNPNVMYELGLAQAIGKRVVVVCQHVGKIPRDLQGYRVLEYSADDIGKFKRDLETTILEALALGVIEKQDYTFPDLELMDQPTQYELKYLRKKAKRVKITVFPPTADVFFKDRFLGTQPQTVRVNTDAPENTISASSVLYFEEHRPLTMSDVKAGHVHIILEGLPSETSKRRNEAEASRAPGYIRWKGKAPNNPALMRAVSHYLLHIKAYGDARAEASELVETAPGWYLAHNQAGHVATRLGDMSSGLKLFQLVRAIRPDNCIGYYNLACVYSLQKEFGSCLYYFGQLLKDASVSATYCYLPFNLAEEDSDFDNIRKDPTNKKEFQSLTRQLRERWDMFKPQRHNKAKPQRLKKLRNGVLPRAKSPQSLVASL